MTWWQGVISVVTVLLSTAGAVLVAKLSHAAQNRRERAQADLGGAELALRIANRAERRIDRLEDWRRRVHDEWWPLHRAADYARDAELHKLDPLCVIPPSPPLPTYVPYTEVIPPGEG